jgi:hypothetical protein
MDQATPPDACHTHAIARSVGSLLTPGRADELERDEREAPCVPPNDECVVLFTKGDERHLHDAVFARGVEGDALVVLGLLELAQDEKSIVGHGSPRFDPMNS